MIITRTADTVDFKLNDSRSISINIAEIAAISLSIGRQADGKLAPALELKRGSRLLTERIEASLEQLSVIHTRIVELMVEICGPALIEPEPAASFAEPFHC